VWFAMHDHGDGTGGHQHFPENGGHGGHGDVALVPWVPTWKPTQS
jgi:hypothetical protein